MGKVAKNQMTYYQKENISLLLIKGYTIKAIAAKYDVSVAAITKHLTIRYNGKAIVPLQFNHKTIPYFTDEMDYGRIPTYTWDELNKEEKDFYNKNAL